MNNFIKELIGWCMSVWAKRQTENECGNKICKKYNMIA